MKTRKDKQGTYSGIRMVRVKEPVPYPEAVRRLQAWWANVEPMQRRYGFPLSFLAGIIWPDHDMRAQGAAFAASRTLKRMRDEGLAGITCGHKTGLLWILK